MECQNHTPEDDVDAQVFAEGDSLDDPICGVFDNEDSDVNTCGQPGVLSRGIYLAC